MFTRRVIVSDSSNICHVMYDADRQKLSVKFHEGATYVFEGVSRKVFGELVSAESVGKYFSANVHKKYSYKKMAA